MLRAESRAAVRANRGRLAAVLVGWVVLTVAVFLATRAFGASDYVVGFNVGVMFGILPLFWQTFLVGRGLSHRLMGADAEEWTAAELARLDRLRWSVFHHVPLERSDVDHVAVGPGRVYAIESKWTARGDIDRFIKGAAGQASRQALELERILRDRGVHRDVLPLLVVWGPGVASSMGEKPRLEGRARVVAGSNARDWLRRMNEAADQPELNSAARLAIEAHVRDREAGS
jgi:hypothetical protein